MVPNVFKRQQNAKENGKPEYWYISPELCVMWRFDEDQAMDRVRKEAGNYFSNEQDAERSLFLLSSTLRKVVRKWDKDGKLIP